jgi:hypothetical protein
VEAETRREIARVSRALRAEVAELRGAVTHLELAVQDMKRVQLSPAEKNAQAMLIAGEVRRQQKQADEEEAHTRRARFWDHRTARYALYVGAVATTLSAVASVAVLIKVLH